MILVDPRHSWKLPGPLHSIAFSILYILIGLNSKQLKYNVMFYLNTLLPEINGSKFQSAYALE